jgi:hypothetical protein
LSISEAVKIAYQASSKNAKAPFHAYKNTEQFSKTVAQRWSQWQLKDFNPDRAISRRELAVLLDQTIDPFHTQAVDHRGNFINK